MIEVLTTERLVLRRFGADDLDAFVDLHADPQVAAFVRRFDREQAARRLAEDADEWERRGHGLLAVTERGGGRLLGRVGLRHWPQFDETEAGWALGSDAWGHGYATEAADALIGWGFERLTIPYVTAMIRPDNVRSQRVAARLGFTPLRDDDFDGVPIVVHAIDPRRWALRRDR